MALDPTIAPAVSAARQRICARNAFFGALALFARVQTSATLPTAATDGRDVFVNTAFFAALTGAEQEALLLHEVLHAALLHVPRAAGRVMRQWNVAADIVVNGMLAREGYHLPAGGLRDASREHLSTEEVYDLLLRDQLPAPNAPWADLLGNTPGDADAAPGNGTAPRAALERYWQQARQQAQVIAETTAHGTLPAGMGRELGEISAGQLDWRTLLWRFLVRSPTDFHGFDRRFVGQGLYLDALDGETLRVAVAVDTSGSIDDAALPALLSEVRCILRTYPHLRCDLYYADADLYGPYALTPWSATPEPQGGGGTDFRPFFAALANGRGKQRPNVAVYLTDGYGDFPDAPPPFPVLWVVTPGGQPLDRFPFGQAVRLLARAKLAVAQSSG